MNDTRNKYGSRFRYKLLDFPLFVNILCCAYNVLRYTFASLLWNTRAINYLQITYVSCNSHVSCPQISRFKIRRYFRVVLSWIFWDLSNSTLWPALPCTGSTLASRKPSSGRSVRCGVLQDLGDEALNFGILSTCAAWWADFRWCWRCCSLGSIGDTRVETEPHSTRVELAGWICKLWIFCDRYLLLSSKGEFSLAVSLELQKNLHSFYFQQ